MARAAAKRHPQVRHQPDRRRHKDAGGQRFEDTLFFNRLRKHAKWMFVFLALVFGVGFVVFGVGSSGVSGLADIFNGVRSSGGGISVNKAQEEVSKNPQSPKAWQDLANAADAKGQLPVAIQAWTQYTNLRPKSVDGLTQLATDYQAQLSNQATAVQTAAYDAQSAQASVLSPPPTSPLGRALGAVNDPIAQSFSNSANSRYSQAIQIEQTTVGSLLTVYGRIAKLQPQDPSAQLQLAQFAQQAGSTATAIAAYRAFIRLAPYDNQVPYAKQQLKSLQSQLKGSSSTSSKSTKSRLKSSSHR